MSDTVRLNLNGEFLGVTSLAVYSAPWFLQPPLIVLVGMMFVFKVVGDSRGFRKTIDAHAQRGDEDELDAILSDVNRIFFGLTVAREDLPNYWMGTLMFIVTLLYSLYNFFSKLNGRSFIEQVSGWAECFPMLV